MAKVEQNKNKTNNITIIMNLQTELESYLKRYPHGK